MGLRNQVGAGRTVWRRAWRTGAAGALLGLCGCTSISIQPACPAELEVGASGPVRANEQDAGAIPIYRWDVTPADAGTFENPAAANTSFQALKEGTAVIRLTAGDGLYEVRSTCQTVIRGAAAVAVSMVAVPPRPTVGQTVTLTCQSVGQTVATSFTIRQVEGPSIRLTETAPGVVTLVPAIPGTPRFECVGETADGQTSSPNFLALTVIAASGNDNGNQNGNQNTNDNGGGRR